MEVDQHPPSNVDETPGPSTSTPPPRLGKCEVCMSQNAKYTCPRCEVKFCCLRCSAIHKRELECDGSRDRAKFIPLNKFTNLDLSSDYRLLEEITRKVETYRKGLKKPNLKLKPYLPKHLFKLKASAHKRKTTLKFLPTNFDRHKRNTSRLNYQTDVISWHVDWIFVHSDNLKLSDDNVHETEKLGSVLQKYFLKQENEVLQEKLQYYQALGLSAVKVLLRAEGKKGVKYYELDINENLKENLRGKLIIEYPIVLIVNKEHSDTFNIIDSDDEDEKMDVDKKGVSGAVVIEKIIKRAESDDSIYNSMRNLLFVSEHSDEED